MAVLGAGVMGSEIAQAAAAAGLDVLLVDSDPAALERGVAHVSRIGERRVARGKMSPEAAAAILGRITPTSDDRDLADRDLAIEAVPEILAVKREVFRRLDAVLPAGAILASNTSGLSISALAGETTRPELVVGLHFFNPASVMRLVEVIEGTRTSEATMLAGEELARALGKTPVRVRECPGFLVNRILVRAMSEGYRRTAEIGADRAAADRAIVDGGPAPMGPFALGDLVGLDTLGHLRRQLEEAYGERFRDGGEVDRQVAAGRLGAKSGAGFYGPAKEVGRSADGCKSSSFGSRENVDIPEYRQPSRPPNDSIFARLPTDLGSSTGPHAGDAADAAADPPGRDVAERYYAGALDEARRCLDEGIAGPADVDLAIRYGCGWSQGPLTWAAEQDLPAGTGTNGTTREMEGES